jgi:prepilin-type N-terminal cleavage/methylation domain-containing protein
MRTACHHIRPRPGYTLLEMLIVVALVALVASVSWPVLTRLSQKRELLEAARQVRVAMLRTRLEAIETGTARQFRYQPGTGIFESSLFSQMEDMVTDTGASPDAALPTGLLPESESAFSAEPGKDAPDQPALPDGVYFVDPESETPLDTEPIDVESDGTDSWSPPILFYPNGRTLNARLQLSNGRYAIDVSLRGLTGTARIGQVRRLLEAGDEVGGGYP